MLVVNARHDDAALGQQAPPGGGNSLLDRKRESQREGRDVSALSPRQHRAALALAEAIIPGGFGVPAADERTLVATERALRGLIADTPIVPKTLGTILETLDAAAVVYSGKRFS